MKRITIEPVSRIEGHAKITIHLDDDGQVTDAKFHVTEFRGFERFCEGRMYTEMPVIVPDSELPASLLRKTAARFQPWPDPTREQLAEQIRITVLHETAHYFGAGEDDLLRFGLN